MLWSGLEASYRTERWLPVVTAIIGGEASWDDLTAVQQLLMPIGYIARCKAATTGHSDVSGPGRDRAKVSRIPERCVSVDGTTRHSAGIQPCRQ